MARQKKTPEAKKSNGASLGFEATLWAMADKQRGHMDAAEYKHVVLGLIFLKYISDAFEEKHTALVEEKKKGADPEDKDEYLAENIFWVPKEARWTFIQGKADTAVKRTSAYFVPLLFVNFWKEDFQCTLGSAQIKNDYKEFMRESFIVELKRSSKFEYAAESAEMTLVIRVKKIDMSAPVNTKGNLLIPIYAFFYNRHAMAGPVDVTVYADVILKKGSVELFIRELQGKYRADILKREQNVSMANYLKDFTPAMIDGLSLAIKDLNEKIVKEINQI